MSNASLADIRPARTPIARLLAWLMARLDHLLDTNARIAARNGDEPYFGL